MITIDVRTKEVRNAREHEPPQYNQFGECSPGYIRGWIPPRYPMPVDIGYVSLGQDYRGVVYIDSADHDWPEMIWHHDTEA